MRHDVVVTGMGALTPLGNCVEQNWQAILAGQSGIGLLSKDLVKDLDVRVGGQILDFDPTEIVPRSDVRRLDTHALFAIKAGLEAMQDSLDEEGKHPFEASRFGVSIGTSAGPVGLFQAATRALDQSGPRRVPPGAVIYGGSDSAASYLSTVLGARGTSVGFGATCASGAVALGEAMRSIRHGYLDAVLVVGAEDCLNRVNLAANAAIRSLATGFGDAPERASRPFDRDRAGFVMSQGSAAILLESAEHAASRKARVFALLAGYGTTSDAYHATAPDPEANGAINAMWAALKDAGIGPDQIDHINAHGTATLLGDAAEAKAISAVFGSKSPVITANKSLVGHLLGAAGVFEAIIAVKSLNEQLVPAMTNLANQDFALDFVVGSARPSKLQTVMSNSFGFGGHNVSLIFT